jgi:hypothetical protein
MGTFRPVTILKAAAERPARSATPLKALLGMSALLLALALPTARAREAESGHNFQFCNGYFALCAASTCSPTGQMIKVNVAGGGTAMFPQVDCKCPIFHGRAIADVTGFRVDQGGLATEDPWAAPIFADRRSERVSFASRANDVSDGLQQFDTVGNDFEDCQEGHGKERAGNPPDRMPKEQ